MNRHLFDTLIATLSPHVDMSKSRLETLALLIVGLIHGRTVNLSHVASQLCGTVDETCARVELDGFGGL